MTVPLEIAAGWIAEQASQGTAATTPEYKFNLTGGSPYDHDISQDVIALTGTAPANGEADRTMIVPKSDLNTLGLPRTLGRFLAQILGQDTMSPAGTHTMIPIVEPLTYSTIWGLLGTDYVRITDAKPATLKISFDNAGLVKVDSSWLGTTSLWASTPASATVDDSAGGITKLRAAGGTFQFDIDSATPVSGCIKSGSVTLTRSLHPKECAGSVTPGDMTAGRLTIVWSLTIEPDSLVDIRNIVTGTPSGTAPTGTPPYGSANVSFLAGSDSLTLTSLRVPYLAAVPASNPDGGIAEVVLEGTGLQPTSGNAITAVMVNTVVSAY